MENLSQRIDDLENGSNARWNDYFKESYKYNDKPGTKLLLTMFQFWFEMRDTESEKREIWKKMQQAKRDGKSFSISKMMGRSRGLSWDNMVSEFTDDDK